MTPEVKERIEKLRRGEVPEGYVQGRFKVVYPLDWAARKMGQWLELKERPVHLKDEETYELVTVRRGFGGVDSRGIHQGKDILVKNYFEVKEGDFLISKRQIAHGACGVVPKELDGAVVSNEYNVFEPAEGTSVEMFNLMMQIPRYKHLFYLMSDGVHIEKLLFKTRDWMNQTLAMPTPEEQQKIAEILTTQDRVIELKEKLIAEKHRQKTYIMQHLLTGKKRISGFERPWNLICLKDAMTVCHGQSQKEIENPEGIYPILGTGGEIGRTNNFLYDKPSVLIGRKGTINRPMYIETPFWTIDTLFFCKVHQNYIPRYLYYLFQTIDWNQYDESSGVPSLNASTIGNIKKCIPAYDEQKAVADILSTADREIELLQQELEQEKQKKKALMQLLLTGIVRV